MTVATYNSKNAVTENLWILNMDMWVDSTEEDNHTGGTRGKISTISCFLRHSYMTDQDYIMGLKLNTNYSNRIYQLGTDDL